MNEQIQINNTNSFINNISYISNDNSNNNQNNNNTLNIKNAQYYSKKKNPRDMSIEELEEYIQKSRARSKNFINNEAHSLNASFTNKYNFGLFDKIDDKNKNDNLFSVKREKNVRNFMDNIEKNNLKININDNLSHKSEIQKEENFSPSINNRGINKYQQVQINSSKIDINNESVNNNILNNNNFSGKNTYNDIEIQSENKQLNNTLSPSNINMNIPSPSFKNINHTLNYTLNNDNEDKNEAFINNSINQDLNINLDNQQNKDNQMKEANNNSTANYIRVLQNKIQLLNQENGNLKRLFSKNTNENNKLLKDIELYKDKISQMEKDKKIYLEEIENDKNYYGKQISELKNENQLLKNLLEEKNKELENITQKFEIERNELIETMKSLREIIIQKENEKNLILFNQNKKLNVPNKFKENLKNKMIPYSNNKENNKKEINITNNYNARNKNNNIKTKMKYNSRIINDNKTIKNKTPLKLMRNKIKTGNIPKKNNSKKDINYKRKHAEYQNNKCYTNYNEINNDIYKNNEFDNVKDELLPNLNLQNEDNLEYLYNINKYRQNLNNNINKNNIPNLNSIRSEFSENIENIKNNNINYEEINKKYMNDNLNKINENIFILERNIPELTREYKNLISKLNSNLDNKENLEINLNALETQIIESKIKLEVLKNYQQEILKNIYEY